MGATLNDLVETDVNVEHVKFGEQAEELRDQIRRNQGVLKQRHCTMYESSDKDEEGKRQGTRKSEADEEDDDYPAANSLDLIKDRFLPFRLFSLFSASIFFLLFSSSPSVACCGMGWHGWRGRLISIVCRLKCIYKRISNGFKTHCHKHISGAFRRRSEMLSKAFPATRLRCV